MGTQKVRFDARAEVITKGGAVYSFKAGPCRQGSEVKIVVNGDSSGALPWVEEGLCCCLISSFVTSHTYVGFNFLKGGEHLSISAVGE